MIMGWCWNQAKFHHSVQSPLQRIANARRPVLYAPLIKILDVPVVGNLLEVLQLLLTPKVLRWHLVLSYLFEVL
jgi:hypothetical protein